MAGTRLAAIGRSQKVVMFIVKIGKDDLELMAGLLAEGKVKSVIDRRYEPSEAAEALRYIGTTHARGKILITI